MTQSIGTGMTLPNPVGIFQRTAPGGANGAAVPAASEASAGNVFGTPQSGIAVTGPGGMTVLPSAAAGQFERDSPNPLDKPDAQYPTLIASHVALMRAMGTSDADIATIARSGATAQDLERYFQAVVLRNPESWDDYVGNPRGTARAGLQRLLPNVTLPAPGTGQTGYMADGTPANGMRIPGYATPIADPLTGAPSKTGLALAAAAIGGVGLLAWRLGRGRGAAGAAAAGAQLAASEGAAVVRGGGAGAAAAVAPSLLGRIKFAFNGGKQAAAAHAAADAAEPLEAVATAVVTGKNGVAAQLGGLTQGLIPGNRWLDGVTRSAVNANLTFAQATSALHERDAIKALRAIGVASASSGNTSVADQVVAKLLTLAPTTAHALS